MCGQCADELQAKQVIGYLVEGRVYDPADVIIVRRGDHAGHDLCPSCGRCRDCGGQHHITCPHR